MSARFGNASKEVFKILKGLGKTLALYDDYGSTTIEPQEARKIFVSPDNIMVSIDDDGADSCLKLFINNETIENPQFQDSILEPIKNIAIKYNLLFSLKTFGKELSPKMFANQVKSLSESQRRVNSMSNNKINCVRNVLTFREAQFTKNLRIGLMEEYGFNSPKTVGILKSKPTVLHIYEDAILVKALEYIREAFGSEARFSMVTEANVDRFSAYANQWVNDHSGSDGMVDDNDVPLGAAKIEQENNKKALMLSQGLKDIVTGKLAINVDPNTRIPNFKNPNNTVAFALSLALDNFGDNDVLFNYLSDIADRLNAGGDVDRNEKFFADRVAALVAKKLSSTTESEANFQNPVAESDCTDDGSLTEDDHFFDLKDIILKALSEIPPDEYYGIVMGEDALDEVYQLLPVLREKIIYDLGLDSLEDHVNEIMDMAKNVWNPAMEEAVRPTDYDRFQPPKGTGYSQEVEDQKYQDALMAGYEYLNTKIFPKFDRNDIDEFNSDPEHFMEYYTNEAMKYAYETYQQQYGEEPDKSFFDDLEADFAKEIKQYLEKLATTTESIGGDMGDNLIRKIRRKPKTVADKRKGDSLKENDPEIEAFKSSLKEKISSLSSIEDESNQLVEFVRSKGEELNPRTSYFLTGVIITGSSDHALNTEEEIKNAISPTLLAAKISETTIDDISKYFLEKIKGPINEIRNFVAPKSLVYLKGKGFLAYIKNSFVELGNDLNAAVEKAHNMGYFPTVYFDDDLTTHSIPGEENNFAMEGLKEFIELDESIDPFSFTKEEFIDAVKKNFKMASMMSDEEVAETLTGFAQQAAMNAFKNEKSGRDVDVLRAGIIYLDRKGKFPFYDQKNTDLDEIRKLAGLI